MKLHIWKLNMNSKLCDNIAIFLVSFIFTCNSVVSFCFQEAPEVEPVIFETCWENE
jgi:hypothetical protein